MIKRTIQNIFRSLGYQPIKNSSESDPFSVQKRLIANEKPIILDVGAHVGSVARIYRERFPLATIHCFEPFPESFEALLKNVENDPLIFCNRLALNAAGGKAKLNVNLSPATNSLLETDARGDSFWGSGLLDTSEQLEVNTSTVDLYCNNAGIKHADILKMDVQGAEYSVLAGAKDMLKAQRISLIYSELIMCPTYKGQHKLHEYLSYLDDLGYNLFDLYNPIKRNDRLIQTDALFVKSALLNAPQNTC